MRFESRVILWLGPWLAIFYGHTARPTPSACGIIGVIILAALSASWLNASGFRQLRWEWRRAGGIKQQLQSVPRRLRFWFWRWRIAQRKDTA